MFCPRSARFFGVWTNSILPIFAQVNAIVQPPINYLTKSSEISQNISILDLRPFKMRFETRLNFRWLQPSVQTHWPVESDLPELIPNN
jgi:hypothetical protein